MRKISVALGIVLVGSVMNGCTLRKDSGIIDGVSGHRRWKLDEWIGNVDLIVLVSDIQFHGCGVRWDGTEEIAAFRMFYSCIPEKIVRGEIDGLHRRIMMFNVTIKEEITWDSLSNREQELLSEHPLKGVVVPGAMILGLHDTGKTGELSYEIALVAHEDRSDFAVWGLSSNVAQSILNSWPPR